MSDDYYSIDSMNERSRDEQMKRDALRNLSIHQSNDMLEGNIKLTFSTADGFCFCSRWKKFKNWFKNLFRRNKKPCCQTQFGLRSYWDRKPDEEDYFKIYIGELDINSLVNAGTPAESNLFEES